jgi:hypothetical protein
LSTGTIINSYSLAMHIQTFEDNSHNKFFPELIILTRMMFIYWIISKIIVSRLMVGVLSCVNARLLTTERGDEKSLLRLIIWELHSWLLVLYITVCETGVVMTMYSI